MGSRYVVVGDTHGNTAFARNVTQFAASVGAEIVLQCGDFGLWDHLPDGVTFLDLLHKTNQDYDVEWVVTLGNHENYDMMDLRMPRSVNIQGDDFHNITDVRSTIHVFKRTGWGVLNQTTPLVVCGGAYSIDKPWRVLGYSYWEQEMINDNDLDMVKQFTKQAVLDCPDDGDFLLITHDSPTSFPPIPPHKSDYISEGNRKYIDEIYDVVKPTHSFHGHMHIRCDYQHKGTNVYGLGADVSDNRAWDAIEVIDIDDFGNVTTMSRKDRVEALQKFHHAI